MFCMVLYPNAQTTTQLNGKPHKIEIKFELRVGRGQKKTGSGVWSMGSGAGRGGPGRSGSREEGPRGGAF